MWFFFFFFFFLRIYLRQFTTRFESSPSVRDAEICMSLLKVTLFGVLASATAEVSAV